MLSGRGKFRKGSEVGSDTYPPPSTAAIKTGSVMFDVCFNAPKRKPPWICEQKRVRRENDDFGARIRLEQHISIFGEMIIMKKVSP